MIKNVEQLNFLRDKMRKEMALRRGAEADAAEMGGRMQILVCGVAGCQSSGSLGVYNELKNLIETNKLEDEIKLISTGCM